MTAMMAPAYQALQGLKRVSLGVQMAEAVDLSLISSFESADQAGQFQAMAQAFIGIGKMAAASGGSGAPAFLDTLNLSAAGADLTLTLRMTEADFTALQGMAKSRPEAPPPPPMGFPEPVPPSGP
jgi:hypothetical protein